MAREVIAEKGHLDRRKRRNSDCKGPKVCVTSNTVYPAGLQGLAVHGESRAGRGISSEVPREACRYQAAGEWGGAIVAQATFRGSAVLYSLVLRGKWNLSGKRCLCDVALSFLPSAWVWSRKPVHVTVDGCRSRGFHHPTESSKALLVTCWQLCLGADSCLEPISLFILLAPNIWG